MAAASPLTIFNSSSDSSVSFSIKVTAIDREVRQIVAEQYQRAKELLSTHRATLNRLAVTLMEKETLLSEELLNIVKGEAAAIS